MPKAIKKRVVKKTGFKEEEVKSAAARFLETVKIKKNVLLPGLIACAAIVVLLVVFISYSASARARAYALEREAYQYYYELGVESPLADEERWKKPLELFQKSVEIRSTPSALFYIGNCYFNLGDYDNAEKAYSRFIDKYSNETVILPLVYQKLASLYISKGENDKAVRTLEELAGYRKGIFRDTALILEARLYDRLGRQEEAMTKYRELVESFPASTWSTEARTRIEAAEKKGDVEAGQQESPAPESRAQPALSD